MGNCHVYCETNLEQIFVQAQNLQPDFLIIDSIQTMFTDRAESSPGSITQVRECSAAVLKFAKETGTPVLMIGHINKEGSIAGPKVLEHIVDTVLQFEGDQHYMYRILRSIKNRFGSTSELGIYEMRQSGLRQVENPSELLLTEGHEGRIEPEGVFGGLERCHGAACVAVVALLQIMQNLFKCSRESLLQQLFVAALGACLHAGREKDLERSVRTRRVRITSEPYMSIISKIGRAHV